MINGLDLFSGIGGISLALSDWVRPVAYCEIDRYARGVLLSRMSDGLLCKAPIWDDVRTLTGKMLPKINLVYGGFPCQDISTAGLGAGLEGKRSGLFFEIIRLVEETNPAWVFLENVPAIRTRGLKQVVRAFTDLGYDCRWTCVSAAELGAPHLRKRWFLLAHAVGSKVRRESRRGFKQDGKSQVVTGHDGEAEFVANAEGEGLEGQRQGLLGQCGGKVADTKGNGRPKNLRVDRDKIQHAGRPTESEECSRRESDKHRTRSQWPAEPDVGRVAYGVSNRLDRLKGLGNAVVPVQALEAFVRLMGL